MRANRLLALPSPLRKGRKKVRGGAPLSSFRQSHGRLGGTSLRGQSAACPPLGLARSLGNPRLCLRFDRDFGFHRVRDEALLMRGMIHLVELLLARLPVAGELRLLPEND